MVKVLVTGSNGFVGSVVCRKLAEAGYLSRAGVRTASEAAGLEKVLVETSDIAILGDISRSNSLAETLRGVSVVVHLAARVHRIHDDALDPLKECRAVNVSGTEALARAAVEQGVRRIVFVSTAKVNGELTTGSPFSEADRPDPQDPYAISKWEAEEALHSIAARTGIEVVIARPPLVYGPGVRANFFRLMKLVAQGIPLPLPPVRNRRSLICVENLADFIVRCVSHPGAANETFMVSDGEDVSTRELVERLAIALGRSARFVSVPKFAMLLAVRLAGKEAAVNRLFGSLLLNTDKASQRLGWKPPVTLDEGLAATARWYLESSQLKK